MTERLDILTAVAACHLTRDGDHSVQAADLIGLLEIEWEGDLLDHLVTLKSDGFLTYHGPTGDDGYPGYEHMGQDRWQITSKGLFKVLCR